MLLFEKKPDTFYQVENVQAHKLGVMVEWLARSTPDQNVLGLESNTNRPSQLTSPLALVFALYEGPSHITVWYIVENNSTVELF